MGNVGSGAFLRTTEPSSRSWVRCSFLSDLEAELPTETLDWAAERSIPTRLRTKWASEGASLRASDSRQIAQFSGRLSFPCIDYHIYHDGNQQKESDSHLLDGVLHI